MRTFLHLFALVWGVGIVHDGLSGRLPAHPLDAYQWGAVGAFGFGVMLMLLGVIHIGARLRGRDGVLGGRRVLLLLVASAVLTVGAMAWKGAGRPTRECNEVLDHAQALFDARDPSGELGRRFEVQRPHLLRECEKMPPARRRCPLRATSVEELRLCQ